jgi:hypothetical protein
MTGDEIADDTPATTGNATLNVELTMHRKRFMMSVDSFAHLACYKGSN